MKTCKEYRAHSKEALQGRWAAAIIFFVVYTVVFTAVQLVVSAPGLAFGNGIAGQGANILLSIISLLVAFPLQYGCYVAYLNYFRDREAKDIPFATLFEGFKDYTRVLGTMMLMFVYVVLWSFLFLIPGIIKSYSYYLTPFILKDRPELSYNAAIEESMRLMDGHKMQLFLLQLSYIGWGLLCIITCGIALLWVAPWMQMAYVDFYEDILAEDAAKNAPAAPAAEAPAAE